MAGVAKLERHPGDTSSLAPGSPLCHFSILGGELESSLDLSDQKTFVHHLLLAQH